MQLRPKDVYKGHRHVRTAVVIVIILILALLITAITLFYSLQKYVVVTPDGVRLELPNSKADGTGIPQPQETDTLPDDLLVIDRPDFSKTDFEAGRELPLYKAVRVPSENVTAAKLSNAAALLQASGADALLLEMKPESGRLSWNSLSSYAYAYDVAGQADLSAGLSALKDAGIYLIAQISCCADDLMATRNPRLAIKTTDGRTFTSGGVSWLDPYNRDLRTYIFSLIDELSAMGFDEILLTNLTYPSGGGFTGGESAAAGLSPEDAINNFAKALKDRYSDGGTKLSLLLDEKQLRNQDPGFTGQNPSQLASFFDRLCVKTGPGQIQNDQTLVCQSMAAAEILARFVPVYQTAATGEIWIKWS